MNNIIFIFGEDSFRSIQTLKEIKLRFSLKNGDFNLIELPGSELTPTLLESQISAVPLFSNKRMIVVRNLLLSKNKMIVEIMALFANLPETTLLIIYESGSPDQRLSVVKSLQNNSTVKKIDRLDEVGLGKFIKNYLVEIKTTIEPDALQLLIINFGDDLWMLTNELKKLATFDPKITLHNVKKLSLLTQNTIVFELTDQIFAGRTSQALKTLDALRQQGEQSLLLLGLIVSTFRNLATIYLAQKNGIARQELARTLKIHPFVVSKSVQILTRLELNKIVSCYEKLFNLDSAIKTGKMDSECGLDLLVAGLARIFSRREAEYIS